MTKTVVMKGKILKDISELQKGRQKSDILQSYKNFYYM